MVLEEIHHLGHAVEDLEGAARFYEENLGATVGEPEEVAHQGVKALMLRVGKSRVELLSPTREDSPIARFLVRRGESLHHIAYRVEDIEAALAELEAKGVTPIDGEPRMGVGGTRTAFVLHPKDALGVLVELVEEPR
jgi:methylmalonyl-CoA/ethylmalonyl-CoA epimerase